MSDYDEFRHANKRWSLDKVEGMVRRVEKTTDPVDGTKYYDEADGWYGQRAAAYDSGEPESILDCIQLEQGVDSIQDLAVKAAVTLSMMGWYEENIGAVIRDRHARTGARLVEDGIRAIARYERGKRR